MTGNDLHEWWSLPSRTQVLSPRAEPRQQNGVVVDDRPAWAAENDAVPRVVRLLSSRTSSPFEGRGSPTVAGEAASRSRSSRRVHPGIDEPTRPRRCAVRFPPYRTSGHPRPARKSRARWTLFRLGRSNTGVAGCATRSTRLKRPRLRTGFHRIQRSPFERACLRVARPAPTTV